MNSKKQFFNQWAKTYDHDVQTVGGPFIGYDQTLQMAAIEVKSTLPEKGNLLDVGIGTGNFASLFASDTNIHGVDISDEMLNQCHQKFPNFVLKEGNFTNIPFEDESMDAVISSFCFHEVERVERKAALEEVNRVLKPGGTVCLVDLMFASEASMNDASRELADKWDDSEDYALIPEVDTLLRLTGFQHITCVQTARCHWLITGKKK
ncbi:MAG: methyltransferase domain-containing protein [Bacillaceae bacterium]|nr:methyltransferase domain-containing protein [Bacillaceae bacterium]